MAMTSYGYEQYDVRSIHPSLLPAPAVIRNHSVQFEIKNSRQSILKVLYAVTIFSKDEQRKGELVLGYSKFTSIEELSGTLYDGDGKEVRELEDEDIKDYSAVDNYTLHDDSRVRYAVLIHNIYPYTVEYSYEIEYNGSLFYPGWYAQSDENPVEHSSFEISAPKNFELRYWCNRDSVKPDTKEIKNQTLYNWHADILPKLPKESLDGDIYDATTIVRIAPSDFQIEDNKGSMKTWKDFGLWFYQLKKDKLLLPDQVVSEIKNISKTAASPQETVKKLYEFMQSRTRYVSVQLGIGGWQPFDATYVHTRGYGDCKALTNYMEALLQQAGIAAYPVLINSGTDRFPMITQFPSNQFNHVILCVPVDKDSIWLECTSQSMPFGMLSYKTENRPALLITSKGGVVVRTPQSTSDGNTQQRSAKVLLTTAGTANATIMTIMSGQRQIATQHTLINATPKEKEDWILEQMEMPNISLASYAIKGLEDHSSKISLEVSAMFQRYASVNGNRIFFYPSLLARRTAIPPLIEKRISPYQFNYPYKNIDSIYFIIPADYTAETLPSEVNIQTSFGSFNGKTIFMGDSAIIYTRITNIRNSSISAERYSEYRTFVADIVKADRSQVVLKKK